MTNSQRPYFIIGKETSDFLKVEVLNYERPDLSDYWDANWLNTRIKIKVGAFSADYFAQLQTIDFREFNKGLDRIYSDLTGVTGFYSLEDWLEIKITGDGIGHFNADCKACDFPGKSNKLEFTLQFDQTEITELLRQSIEILDEFPVKGQPDNEKK